MVPALGIVSLVWNSECFALSVECVCVCPCKKKQIISLYKTEPRIHLFFNRTGNSIQMMQLITYFSQSIYNVLRNVSFYSCRCNAFREIHYVLGVPFRMQNTTARDQSEKCVPFLSEPIQFNSRCCDTPFFPPSHLFPLNIVRSPC